MLSTRVPMNVSPDPLLSGAILSILAPTGRRVISRQSFKNTINRLGNQIGNVACS